jgi:hypothetical protein
MADKETVFRAALNFAASAVRDLPERTTDQIREFAKVAVDAVRLMHPGSEPVSVDELVATLRHQFTVTVDEGLVLDETGARGHVPWLHAQRTSMDWRFWNRYREYLAVVKRLPPTVIDSTDRITDSIIERLESPSREGPWDRRGMVVGAVQSGKTSNYTGLVCKALDAGYKVVIILAGIHNDLRSQTQLRIDEGVLGFDSQKRNLDGTSNSRIGVGRINDLVLVVNTLTNSSTNGDFSKKVADNVAVMLGSDPLVFVVKKNSSVLKNLAKCLEHVASATGGAGKIIKNVPLLLIDDEADNASINTAKRAKPDEETQEITAINRHIRSLLATFDKSAYVGYTATPFANIFIDPKADEAGGMEDLFPRSFIINLPPPSNYIGPKRVFGLGGDPDAGIEPLDPLPIVHEVSDHDTPSGFPFKHKIDHAPTELPESLCRAIRCFILTCAARRARGQLREHNSMLVHVTRYVEVQKRVVTLVDDLVYSLRRRLEYGDGAKGKKIIDDFRQLWESEYLPVSRALGDDGQQTPWPDVEKHLLEAVSRITVKGINGQSQDALDYRENQSEGLSVIAIGGDKLSRGLTLEGLSISYFLRTSSMYDTLMQMGRWFGYRPGYLDLCRLYTTTQLVDWYRHIALAEEELRREFEYMHASGCSPEEYGLRVRTHPGGMTITALNKLSHTRKLQLSWEGQLVQTWALPKLEEMATTNFKLTDKLCASLGQPEPIREEGGFIWRDIPANKVWLYLQTLLYPAESARASGREVAEYIRKQNEMGSGELTQWSVVLLSKKTGDTFEVGGNRVRRLERTVRDGDVSLDVTKANLLNPEDEASDLVGQRFDASWLASIADKPELAEDLDFLQQQVTEEKNVDEVAKALTIRWRTSTPPKLRGSRSGGVPADRANGRIIRLLRRRSHGLLMIYPMSLKDDKKGVETPAVNPFRPMIGVAVSLPTSHTASGVEYVVGKVWDLRQLEDPADEE